MYNKLFTKILDSSIWLAPDPHRLVWITLIAAMDEDGNAMFACVDNLAARARVSVKQADAAVASFEQPDPKSGDPDNDGRRIERFPGGWRVLNAHKYRAMVTKDIIREQTRIRTAKWRANKAGDAPVTQSDETVTTSEALSGSEAASNAETKRQRARSALACHLPADFALTPEREAVAKTEHLDPSRTFAAFKDYWVAASGAKARKRDWDAAWRTWCRTEADRGAKNGTSRGRSQPRLSAVERVYAATEHLLGDVGKGG